MTLRQSEESKKEAQKTIKETLMLFFEEVEKLVEETKSKQ
jgi:hypothetical protein